MPGADARRGLLPCLLAALLLASAGIGTVSALDWTIETVDPTAHDSGGCTLVLDDAGTPAISYAANGELRYAHRNGTINSNERVPHHYDFVYRSSFNKVC